MRRAAFSKRRSLFLWVATMVPLPGSASPRASLRQFMELAVNSPEHDPHDGHAANSMSRMSASGTALSADITMASIRSYFRPFHLPASMGPPDTKMAGTLSRMAAMSMPGVILSQLEMQIMASAMWAFIMYSTLSAMSSREGSEYSMPLCPMAMPSSMAMVSNSAAKHPCASMIFLTCCPMSCRCTCPGTNWRERIDNCDYRLSELLLFHAVGAPEAPGPGHAAAGRGCRAAQGVRHAVFLSVKDAGAAAPAALAS